MLKSIVFKSCIFIIVNDEIDVYSNGGLFQSLSGVVVVTGYIVRVGLSILYKNPFSLSVSKTYFLFFNNVFLIKYLLFV